MSDQGLPIPNHPGWPQSTITEVSEFVARGTAPVYVESSDVLAIGQRCVTDRGFDPSFARPHDQRRMRGVLAPRSGDVLVNSTGTGTIGRSCVYDSSGRFIVDGHITVVRPRQDSADGRWIEALIRSPWGQSFLEGQCYSGSTNQVELSSGRFSRTLIPLPSIQEQHRIADILDTAADAIRSTELLIAKLEQAKQGLLHDLVTRGIDDSGQLREPDSVPSQLGTESAIRHGWRRGAVGDFLQRIEAGWSPGCDEIPPMLGEWGVLKVNAVSGGSYDPVASKRLPEGLQPRPELEVKAGDVLLARANGVADLVAITVEVGSTPPCLMLSDKILRLVPNERELCRPFLALLLQSAGTRRQILQLLNGSSGQKNISQGLLRELDVIIPSLSEQHRIVSVWKSRELAVAAERENLAKFRLMKLGLMDDLLTGRIRMGASE